MMLWLLAASAFAQVTAVTITYDAGDRQHLLAGAGPMGYGGTMQITATGAWTVNAGTCTTLSTLSPTGTGTTTNRFSWNSTGSNTVSAGVNFTDYSCSGTVTGVSSSSVGYTINRRVWRKSKPLFVTDMLGNRTPFSGYTNASGLGDYTEYGVLGGSDAYPPNDGVAFPALGEAWTDPKFGGKMIRVGTTGPGAKDYAVPYNAYRFSKNGTYTYARNRGIIRATPPYDVVAPLPPDASPTITGCLDYQMIWSYASATELYGYCYDRTDASVIRKFQVVPGSPGSLVEVCSGSPCSTNPWFKHTATMQNSGGGAGAGTGASTPITRDTDEMAMMSAAAGQVCIINLVSKTANCVSHVPSRDLRTSAIAPARDYAGNLYAFYGSDVPSATNVFRLNKAGVLSFLGDMPRANVWTYPATDGHMYGFGCRTGTDDECSRNGHLHFFYANGRAGIGGNALGSRTFSGYYTSWGNLYVSSELYSGQFEEAGGGWSAIQGTPDEYETCALGAPVCIQSDSGRDVNTCSITCTGASGTVTCTLSDPVRTEDGTASGYTCPTANYTTGARVLLNRLSVSSWNGYKTLASASGSTITFADASTGTSITGWVTRAIVNTDPDYERGHLLVKRMDNGHSRFILKMPAATLNETYFQLPHTQPNWQGSWVSVNSSLGYPGELNMFLTDTGFRCPTDVRPNDFCGDGGAMGISGGITLRESAGQIDVLVRAPLPYASCTVEHSATWDYASATSSTGTGNRTVTIGSLSAGDTRYVRAWCDGKDAAGIVRPNWHYAIATGIAK